jgi:hypothetical protein
MEGSVCKVIGPVRTNSALCKKAAVSRTSKPLHDPRVRQ